MNQPSVTEQRLNSLDKLQDIDGEEEAFSAVLHREKLVKDFNCKGYLNFRNLARVSRPKKEKKNEPKCNKERAQNEKGNVYSVQLVKNKDEEDWSGLLGEGFNGGSKWLGPTRLLLLDETYANKGEEELPQAVMAVLVKPTFELVQCSLTLYYNYWQMNEVLRSLLPDDVVVPTGFEMVGHIAHLNLSYEHAPYKKLIAQVVLDKNKSKIKTVVNKVDAIQNEYRTMELEVLAGNHSLSTMVIENGIRFMVDLKAVYWNSKLAGERQRLVGCFCETDVVCDVFSGVGPIAISAAKKVKYVYANDLNPTAVEYLERNIVLNKLDKKIEVSNMDGRRFIQSIFGKSRTKSVTQVVMNLPKDAAGFLDCFRGIFSKGLKDSCCTLPKIHLYGFSKAENPEFDLHERINLALCETVEEVEMHRVRLVAPGKWMLCASFTLPKSVAFA